jgi:uncharacterized membrane protein (DUF106 family)
MKVILTKVFVSAIASGAIILLLYSIARLSENQNPMYFFDIGMSVMSFMALLMATGLLIGRVFGWINQDFSIFVSTFSLVSILVLTFTYTSAASSLFYLVLGVYLFVLLVLGIFVFRDYYSKRNSMVK